MTERRWRIGDVEICQIIELEAGKIIQETITQAQPENVKKITWLRPNFADAGGQLKALVQSFLIKSNGRNILIDTCNGNDKNRTDMPVWSKPQTKFLEKLSQLGVEHEKVDIVACTHLHCDHVGWNTKWESGGWVPTFPKAQYSSPLPNCQSYLVNRRRYFSGARHNHPQKDAERASWHRNSFDRFALS